MFDILIICHGVDLFGFILFITLCASCAWMSVSLPGLGKFLTSVSLNKFSVPSS